MSATSILTPGGYLKRRRIASGRSIDAVALALDTDPQTAEPMRKAWLELIEKDITPLRWSTIVALRRQFAFDLEVLEQLSLVQSGVSVWPPQLCRVCACSEHDACTNRCSWIERDLCSTCAPIALASAA